MAQTDASGPAPADAAQTGVAPGSDAAMGQAITWTTQRYALTADAFHIEVGGKQYQAQAAATDIIVRGDPGDPTYMTIEITWVENAVEMRLNIYLQADGSSWWADEIRTYDGEADGDWVYYTGEFFKTPLGTQFAGNIDLVSDVGQVIAGSIHFENLRLSVFEAPAECGGTVPGYVLTKPIAQVDASLDSNFRMYVLLRDAVTCDPIVDQADFTYTWSIDDSTVATIDPDNFCIEGVMSPCPMAAVDISAEMIGTTTIRAAVTETAGGVEVARATIPTSVY